MIPRISTLYDAYRAVSGILRIGTSINKFYSLYSSDWLTSRVLINTIIVIKEMISEGMLLSELGYERRHRDELKNHEQILGTLLQPIPSNYHLYNPWGFGDDTLQRDRAWVGIEAVVESYRSINGQFEKVQWLGLGVAALRAFQQEKLSKTDWALLLGHEFVKIIRFRTKVYCDSSLSIRFEAKVFLSLYDAAQMGWFVIKTYKLIKEKWFAKEKPSETSKSS